MPGQEHGEDPERSRTRGGAGDLQHAEQRPAGLRGRIVSNVEKGESSRSRDGPQPLEHDRREPPDVEIGWLRATMYGPRLRPARDQQPAQNPMTVAENSRPKGTRARARAGSPTARHARRRSRASPPRHRKDRVGRRPGARGPSRSNPRPEKRARAGRRRGAGRARPASRALGHKSLQTVLLLGFDERDGLYYNARATVKPDRTARSGIHSASARGGRGGATVGAPS